MSKLEDYASIGDIKRIANLAKVNEMDEDELKNEFLDIAEGIQSKLIREMGELSVNNNFNEVSCVLIFKGNINFVTLQMSTASIE